MSLSSVLTPSSPRLPSVLKTGQGSRRSQMEILTSRRLVLLVLGTFVWSSTSQVGDEIGLIVFFFSSFLLFLGSTPSSALRRNLWSKVVVHGWDFIGREEEIRFVQRPAFAPPSHIASN